MWPLSRSVSSPSPGVAASIWKRSSLRGADTGVTPARGSVTLSLLKGSRVVTSPIDSISRPKISSACCSEPTTLGALTSALRKSNACSAPSSTARSSASMRLLYRFNV